MMPNSNHSILRIMEEMRQPIPLPHCLSKEELDYFLDLIAVSVDRIGDILIVVHAKVGPVAWLWDEGINQYCVGALGPGI